MLISREKYFAKVLRNIEELAKADVSASVAAGDGDELAKPNQAELDQKYAETHKAFLDACIKGSTEFRDDGHGPEDWFALMGQLKLGPNNWTRGSWRPEIYDEEDKNYFLKKMVKLGDLFNSEAGKKRIGRVVFPKYEYPEDNAPRKEVQKFYTAQRKFQDRPRTVFDKAEQKLRREFRGLGYNNQQFHDLMRESGAEARIQRGLRLL